MDENEFFTYFKFKSPGSCQPKLPPALFLMVPAFLPGCGNWPLKKEVQVNLNVVVTSRTISWHV
ncbi:MAG: hypothetical protein BGO54_17720 [Sphingobacteriales bacterium 46-32]|nr:MAG: hypothetical protein BGO54_17720 [Sphingobacteriales bacterium 46-32]